MNSACLEDGGPAFPATEEHGCNSGWSGMSLRAYTTIKLAAAMLSNPAHSEFLHDHDSRAGIALDGADAILRALHMPPQRVEQPFDPATLTSAEKAALDRLTGWVYFDDLPANLKERATATAAFLQSVVADDSIPF